ncbi:LamG domain-containing protein [Tenggerimyces flavus]|uniref:LamG-like jellyroll fold domain-containing protein n=1 Tax=Tenggerimyces flavus TaxID=1708749 RepID=A0ABV7YIG3_9ACTN|nr:LamG domain-containing protein [Tenggerimyces flavus]MBM7790010.1 hypothetical protein [Tenggerimyces flavus]
MRRVAVVVALSVLAVSAAVAQPATARTGPDGTGPAQPPLSRDYVTNVDDALWQTRDRWGEKLIAGPEGPTLENVEPLLVPANQADRVLTDSSWVYLPLTYPKPNHKAWQTGRAFALHVLDGSQILTNWSRGDLHVPRRTATFRVGGGNEIYGSDIARLQDPKLTGGHLPILATSYTDSQGVRWDREAFVTRLNGQLVSHVRFTARGNAAKQLRVGLVGSGVNTATLTGNRIASGATTYLAWSGAGATWSASTLTLPVQATAAGTTVNLVLPNTPANLGAFAVTPAAYDAAKTAIASYWNGQLAGGATVEVPEPYAMDAMRNLLIQNLVMGWQQSIGNPYEGTTNEFAFVPEVSASVQVLGEFGYATDFRTNLEEILRRGQQATFFRSWEKGFKLQSAASHYLLTGDADYVLDNLATLQSYLADFRDQRDADPNGLLAKARYASDIDDEIYGIHHQAEGWRGMRDMGIALRRMGRTTEANAFTSEANEHAASLRAAITQSQTTLPDGSIFVPISLLDEDAPAPYDQISATTLGSYWNLIIPYFLATGLWEPGSTQAKGMLKYLYNHGATFLGLTRFNLMGVDPGICYLENANQFGGSPPGYRTTGVDEQYGYSRVRFLADNEETDRLILNFYGKLAHDLTPHTFVGGEGVTVSSCPEIGEYYRTQYFPPLSANNATYLEALRLMLVREDLAADGMPTTLRLTPATPRGWLANGKRIAVTDLPTKFGPVSYEIESQLASNTVTADVTLPSRAGAAPQKVLFSLRAPAGHRLASATVNGQARPVSGDTVDLGVVTGQVAVRGTYETVAAARRDQAEPVRVDPGRKVFQPGQQVAFDVTMETLGGGVVDGSLTLASSTPGVTAPATPFALASNGKLVHPKVRVTASISATAAVGKHTLTFRTTPASGPEGTFSTTIEIARPVAEAYADLVRGDRPTGYWRLGEPSGSTSAADSSPYGTTGTVRGTATRGEPGAIAGDADRATRLTGGYVELPDVPPVTPTTVPTSFEGWFKIPKGYQQGLFEKYDAPARNGIALRMLHLRKLQFLVMNGTVIVATANGKTNVTPDEWHHVVATSNATEKRLYLDGELEAVVSAAGNPTDGVATVKLGARGDDAATRLAGSMDEVAIYDHALSAAEVKEHYLKGVLGVRLP